MDREIREMDRWVKIFATVVIGGLASVGGAVVWLFWMATR